jgi:hypothetical protein
MPESLRNSSGFMDIYVLLWACLISATLFSGHAPIRLAVPLAGYRIIDIVNYRVFFLLVKSQDRPWSADVLRRSLVIAVVNFYEVVTGFAVLYLACRCIAQPASSPQYLSDPLSAFYYSLVTMATVGYGDFVPTSGLGKFLVICQITTTIVFVLFLLPALVSVFSSSLNRNDGKGSD